MIPCCGLYGLCGLCESVLRFTNYTPGFNANLARPDQAAQPTDSTGWLGRSLLTSLKPLNRVEQTARPALVEESARMKSYFYPGVVGVGTDETLTNHF